MKKNYSVFSIRSIFCGAIAAISCFISRTVFGSPLNMMHMTEGINFLPPIWIFNLLSMFISFMIGMSYGWSVDEIVNGRNAGTREIYVYRGALYLSFAFFLFLIWYPLLFCEEKIFLSFCLSVIALICSLICAVEWSKTVPTRASLIIFSNTAWLFYIMFSSLSILLNS